MGICAARFETVGVTRVVDEVPALRLILARGLSLRMGDDNTLRRVDLRRNLRRAQMQEDARKLDRRTARRKMRDGRLTYVVLRSSL